MPQNYPDNPSDFATFRRALAQLALGRLNSCRFADLANLKYPPPAVIFVEDGCDIGESGGSGTGCFAVRKADGDWYRLDNTVVTA